MQIWERSLTIYVDVSEEWLLPNGEQFTDDNVVAAEAWKQIREDVQIRLDGLYRDRDKLKFEVDWEDTPHKVS